MTPRDRLFAHALPGLLRGGLGMLCLVLAVLLVPAQLAGAAPRVTEPDDVFTAMIERVERDPGTAGRPARYTYTVQVQQVYGDSVVSSVRVRVQTSADFGECGTRPESPGQALYVWRLTRRDDALVADGCRDVLRATELRTAGLEATYGAPRAPTESTPQEPPVEFPAVTYSCPETSEAVSDVADAEAACEEVAAPQAFDRAAAPGLALIIIGVLGWIVVARLGRRRRA